MYFTTVMNRRVLLVKLYLHRSCCQWPGGGRGDTDSALLPLPPSGNQTGIAGRDMPPLLEGKQGNLYWEPVREMRLVRWNITTPHLTRVWLLPKDKTKMMQTNFQINFKWLIPIPAFYYDLTMLLLSYKWIIFMFKTLWKSFYWMAFRFKTQFFFVLVFEIGLQFKQEMTHCCRCIHLHPACIQAHNNSDSYRAYSCNAGNTVSPRSHTHSHLESIWDII